MHRQTLAGPITKTLSARLKIYRVIQIKRPSHRGL